MNTLMARHRICIFLASILCMISGPAAFSQYAGKVLLLDTSFSYCQADLFAYDFSDQETASEFTVEGWIYVPDYMNVMTGIDASRGNDSLRQWKIIVGGYAPYNTSHSMVIQFYDAATNQTSQYGSFDEVVVNAWNHFAVMQNGPYLQLYVNGKLSSTYSTTRSVWGMTSLTFGSSKGRFDRLRFWNTSRSATDVVNGMWQSYAGTSNAGLVAEYNFENTYGITLYEGAKQQRDVVPNNPLGSVFTNSPGISWKANNAGFIHSVLNVGSSAINQNSSDSAYINWADDGKTLTFFDDYVNGQFVKRTQRTWKVAGTYVPHATITFNPTQIADLDVNRAILIFKSLVDSTTSIQIPSLNSGGYLVFHPDMTNDSLFEVSIGQYSDSLTSSNYGVKLSASLGWGPFTQADDNKNRISLTSLPVSADSVTFVIERSHTYENVDSVVFNDLTTDSVNKTYQMGDLPVDVLFRADVHISSGGVLEWVEPISIVESQPRITASDNFGGYALGTDRKVQYQVDSLPDSTTQVTIAFVDANNQLISHQSSQGQTVNDSVIFDGRFVQSAAWQPNLDTLGLTLSSKLAVNVKHAKGLASGTTYYVSLNVQAARIAIASANGFGPFYTNGYSQRETSGPTITSRYSVGPVPPRTTKVVYTITDSNNVILWSDSVLTADQDSYLDSAQTLSHAVTISNLSPKAAFVYANLFAQGGPVDGLLAVADLTVLPQPPTIYMEQYTGFVAHNPLDPSDTTTFVQEVRVGPTTTVLDSIEFEFLDINGNVLYSETVDWTFDVVTAYRAKFDFKQLPYTVDSLRVTSYAWDVGAPVSNTVHIGMTPPRPKLTALFSPAQSYFRGQHLNEQFRLTALTGEISRVGFIAGSDTSYFTRNSSPYHHHASLDTSLIFTHRPNHTFTYSCWIRTTDTVDMGIVGATLRDEATGDTLSYHPMLYMKEGRLYATLYGNHDIVTPVRFNDGIWHNVVAVYDYSGGRVELWVDGGMVSRLTGHPNIAVTKSGYHNPQFVIGRGDISVVGKTTTVPGYFFVGDFTEFSTWNVALSAADIAKIYSGYDLQSIGSTQPISYLTFEQATDTALVHAHQVFDRISATWKNISGQPEWTLANEITHVNFTTGIYSQYPSAGNDSIRVLLESSRQDVQTGVYSWPMQIQQNPSQHLFTVASNSGFGPFYEGMDAVGAITAGISYVGDDEYGRCYASFLTEDSVRIMLDTVEFSGRQATLNASVDFGEAEPGSTLELLFDFEYGIPTARHQEIVKADIIAKPLSPPSIAGHTGPFKQAIADGTMEDENTFTITSFENGVYFKGTFYTPQWEKIDSVWANRTDDSTWTLIFDMAKLWPPTSRLVIETFVGSDKVAAVRDTLDITITKTRPQWFDDHDVKFSDVNSHGGKDDPVYFVVSAKIGKPNILDVNTSKPTTPHLSDKSEQGAQFQFLIPPAIPFMGNLLFLTEYPQVSVPLVYYPTADQLDIDNYSSHALNITSNNFFSGPGVDPINFYSLQQDFDTEVTNKELFIKAQTEWQITAPNTLLKLMGAGGIGGAGSPSFTKLIQGQNAFEGLSPGGMYITIFPSITIGGGSRINVGVDTTSQSWGALGDLDLSGASKNVSSNNAGYNIAQIGVGLTFGIGYQLMFGAVAAEADFTTRFVLSVGKAYVTAPKPKSSFVSATSFQLYAAVQVKALWGLAAYTLWGPDMLWHYEFGDHIPPLWPHPKDPKWLTSNFSPTGSKGAEAVQQVAGTYVTRPTPSTHPQAATDDFETGSLIVWLEQDALLGRGTLKLSALESDSSKFSPAFNIVSNNQAISHPRVARLSDSIAAVVWMQSRLSSDFNTQNLSPLQQLNSLDIWYAIVNVNSATVQHVSMMEDDIASVLSGRYEGSPDVVRMDDNNAMVLWVVPDVNDSSSDIVYSIVSTTNGQATSINEVAKTEGMDRGVKASGFDNGNLICAWINQSGPNEADTRVMMSAWDGSSWAPASTVLSNGANQHYNEMDIDANGTEAVLAVTCVDNTWPIDITEYVSVIPWNGSGFDVANAYQRRVPQRTLRDPHAHINADGRAAVTYRALHTAPTVGDTVSQVDIIVGDLDERRSVRHHTAHNEICDVKASVKDADGMLVGDHFVLFSHELIDDYSVHTPSNGKLFGVPSMHLVMRGMKIDQYGIIRPLSEDSLFSDSTTVEVSEEVLGGDVVGLNIAPNPSSGNVNISVDLTTPAEVNLTLLDLRGSVRAEIHQGMMSEGHHSFNLSSAQLESGAYVLRLVMGQQVLTRMVLIIR